MQVAAGDSISIKESIVDDTIAARLLESLTAVECQTGRSIHATVSEDLAWKATMGNAPTVPLTGATSKHPLSLVSNYK